MIFAFIAAAAIALLLGLLWRGQRRLSAAVNEQLRLRQELAAADSARKFFVEIFDQIGDPIFVKDRDHRLFYVNDAECRLSHRSREELLGRTDYDFFPKEQVDVFWRKDDLVLQTGQEDVNEERITTADGTLHTIITKKTRYVDEQGNPYIVGIIRDITDRKRVEDEIHLLNATLEKRVAERTAELRRVNTELEDDILRRQTAEHALSAEKERLAVTLRSIGDGVIATDVQQRVQLLNRVAETLTGWSATEALDRPVQEVLRLRGIDPNKPAHPLDRAKQPSSLNGHEALLTGRDGVERTISLTVTSLRTESGAVLGQVIAFRDITQQKLFEQQVVNNQRLESIGVLAAGIAHDFNNLLTAVFGHLELARTSLDQRAQAERHLDESTRAWKRARSLTHQLLTFAKGGAPVKRTLALGPLLRQGVQFILSGSAVRCEFHLLADLWHCEVDEGQIGQVIDNIVINAMQAMTQGHLRIEARNVTRADPAKAGTLRRYVEIDFHDDGPGIPPEVLQHVFDPFYTTKSTGSGLGLTTVYSIVKKHEGDVQIRSALGEGTTVTVLLPASEEKARQEPSRSLGSTVPHSRLLIIDDEEVVRGVLSQMLKKIGQTVTTAASGSAGVVAYEEALKTGKRFDAVILDLTLPGGLSGHGTLQRLQALDPSVRAIASSGYFADPIMGSPEAYGFVGTLPKPYTFADVTRALGEALSADLRRPE